MVTLTVAIWGAVLSTIVATAQLWAWLRQGPRFKVWVLRPAQDHSHPNYPDAHARIAVMNVGTVSAVLTRLQIHYFSEPKPHKQPRQTRTIDATHIMDPSSDVDAEDGSAKMLPPNTERHFHDAVPSWFEMDHHSIQALVWLRGRREPFVGQSLPGDEAIKLGGANA